MKWLRPLFLRRFVLLCVPNTTLRSFLSRLFLRLTRCHRGVAMDESDGSHAALLRTETCTSPMIVDSEMASPASTASMPTPTSSAPAVGVGGMMQMPVFHTNQPSTSHAPPNLPQLNELLLSTLAHQHHQAQQQQQFHQMPMPNSNLPQPNGYAPQLVGELLFSQCFNGNGLFRPPVPPQMTLPQGPPAASDTLFWDHWMCLLATHLTPEQWQSYWQNYAAIFGLNSLPLHLFSFFNNAGGEMPAGANMGGYDVNGCGVRSVESQLQDHEQSKKPHFTLSLMFCDTFFASRQPLPRGQSSRRNPGMPKGQLEELHLSRALMSCRKHLIDSSWITLLSPPPLIAVFSLFPLQR
uniref:Uncharacterized protein n=1 Tax=Panagrellus redivivus TaxID=6233 RepID=A0A7E4VJ93_PANRE